jgi:hypothetical protein
MAYPPVPSATFDSISYVRDHQLDDHEDAAFLLTTSPVIHEDGSVYFPELECLIPKNVARSYLSRGQWDDPTFTDRERIMAWHLHCEQEKNNVSRQPNPRANYSWSLAEKADLLKSFSDWVNSTSEYHGRSKNAIQLMLKNILSSHLF